MLRADANAILRQDADVKFITESGSFSNVSEAKALREENDQLQDANTTLIIVVASLGGAVGFW